MEFGSGELAFVIGRMEERDEVEAILAENDEVVCGL